MQTDRSMARCELIECSEGPQELKEAQTIVGGVSRDPLRRYYPSVVRASGFQSSDPPKVHNSP